MTSERLVSLVCISSQAFVNWLHWYPALVWSEGVVDTLTKRRRTVNIHHRTTFSRTEPRCLQY